MMADYLSFSSLVNSELFQTVVKFPPDLLYLPEH